MTLLALAKNGSSTGFLKAKRSEYGRNGQSKVGIIECKTFTELLRWMEN
jgi:hypothetical protein